VLEHPQYYPLREELIGFLSGESGASPSYATLEMESSDHGEEAVA
jgi:hypothetical protein